METLKQSIERLKADAIKSQRNWNFPNEHYIEASGIIMACDQILEWIQPIPSTSPLSDTWISVSERIPDQGIEVLLFSDKWIDEDFNPNGTRIGYLDGIAEWVSAYWCNYHDEYHTRTSVEDDSMFAEVKAIYQIPTHWMPIKTNPLIK